MLSLTSSLSLRAVSLVFDALLTNHDDTVCYSTSLPLALNPAKNLSQHDLSPCPESKSPSLLTFLTTLAAMQCPQFQRITKGFNLPALVITEYFSISDE